MGYHQVVRVQGITDMSIKNNGYIYLITNNVNGKMYVGQTSKTPLQRFKMHVQDSYRNNERYNSALHRAIRKYGESNFKIETLEECEIESLNSKEIYWIDKLGTFKNGYNMTLGGEGSNRLDIPDKKEFTELSKIYTATRLAEHYKVYLPTIYSWADKYNIKLKTHKRAVATVINGVEYKFETLNEAGQWLIDEGFTCSTKGSRYVAYYITKSINESKTYLGLNWYFI